MGLMYGLRMFSLALSRVWTNPELRSWYFKTLVWTLLLAFLLVIVLFSVGTYALSTFIESNLYAGFAVVLWTIALFYVGGQVAALLMNGLVLFVGGENALTQVYLKDAPLLEEKRKQKLKREFQARSVEILSMLRTLAIAAVIWPCFLIPFLIPVGVIVFAWAMAGDSLAIAKKLAHLKGVPTLQDDQKITFSTKVGLALLPSSLAMFPVVGWVLLPVLQVAGLELQIKGAATQARVEGPTK